MSGPAAPLVCAACGEANTPGSTRCWVCSRSLVPGFEGTATPPRLPPRPPRERRRWDPLPAERSRAATAIWIVVGVAIVGTLPTAPGLSVLLAALALPVALLVPTPQAPPSWAVAITLILLGIAAALVAAVAACAVVLNVGGGSDRTAGPALLIGGLAFGAAIYGAVRILGKDAARRRRWRRGEDLRREDER